MISGKQCRQKQHLDEYQSVAQDCSQDGISPHGITRCCGQLTQKEICTKTKIPLIEVRFSEPQKKRSGARKSDRKR